MHPIEKYIDTSEYIIKAKVQKIIQKNGDSLNVNRAMLIISKVYKGGIKKNQIIEFNYDETDCAFKFKLNKKYLLFCGSQSDKFYVYECSYSDQVSYSHNNIRKIKKYIANNNNRVLTTGAGMRGGQRAMAFLCRAVTTVVL